MIRAPLALAFMLGAGLLLIGYAGEITARAVALLDPETAGAQQVEAVARFAVAAVIILAAMLGALLFRQKLTVGSQAPMLSATALPSGVVGVAIVIILASVAGASAGRPGPGGAEPAGFLLGTILILLAAMGEELLLRGFLQPILVRGWGAFAGIVATSAAFMLVHIIGGWAHPLSLLNIFLAGIWFGLLAYRTGGLVAPVLAHAGYNWAEEMLFGASPNPGVSAFGALMDVELEGPAIWGGSVEGLNASLPLSLFLIIMVAALAWPAVRGRHIGGAVTAR